MIAIVTAFNGGTDSTSVCYKEVSDEEEAVLFFSKKIEEYKAYEGEHVKNMFLAHKQFTVETKVTITGKEV
jgi:hypothetical protein